MKPTKNNAEDWDCDVVDLHPLAGEIPNIDSAVAEIARFPAKVTFRRATIFCFPPDHAPPGVYSRKRLTFGLSGGLLDPTGCATLPQAYLADT